MIRHAVSFIFVMILVCLPPRFACATFIDLRGINIVNPSSVQITVDGITVSLTGSILNSTPTRFGVDSAGANDVPDLLDGGNGVAESVGFLFSPVNAVLDSIVISEFDAADAGVFDFKGSGDLALTNGVNSIPSDLDGATSLHSIRWTGENSPGGTRGFSIDGFNLHLVPEPSTFVLCAIAMLFVLPHLRRRLKG